MAARYADIARWIPVDVPYLWVWGLLVACGVLLLSGRRRWGAYALAFIGIGMGICYLPRFAAFLSKLPFELGVAAVVLALLGLRRVCRFGSQIFPREEVPEPRVPDSLGRARLYSAIHADIRRRPLRFGSAVAIFGEWGSGKSHLLQYLTRRLEHPYTKEAVDDPELADPGMYCGRYVVSKVMLWQYHSSSEALAAIAEALFRAVTNICPIPTSRFSLFFWRLFCMLYGIENELIKSAVNSLVGHDGTGERRIEEINHYLAAQKRRAVLVIEDVERAEIEVIEHFLPLMERLKSIQALTILCALDPDELKRKCKHSLVISGALQGYLDKIFDISYPLPALPKELADVWFSSYCAEYYPACTHLSQFSQKSQIRFRTPRQVQRAAARLASVERMYLGEQHDLFEAWSCGINMIFYVEVLDCLYHEVFQELSSQERPAELLNNYLKKNDESVRQRIPLTLELMSQDVTLRSLADIFAQDAGHYSARMNAALGRRYVRRIRLSDEEKRNIIVKLGESPDTPPAEMCKRCLGVESLENDKGAENILEAYAMEQILEKSPLFQPASTFLLHYLRGMPRRYSDTDDMDIRGSDHIFRVASFNSLAALFRLRCCEDTDAVSNEIYELVADKVSIFSLAEFKNLLLMVRNGREATDETVSWLCSIIQSKETTVFKRESEAFHAYFFLRLLDYYRYLAEPAAKYPSFITAETIAFDSSSAADCRQLMSTLRRAVTESTQEDNVQLLAGWINSLCIPTGIQENEPLCYAVSLRTARMLLPFLRSVAQSPDFCAALRGYFASVDEYAIRHAITCLKKEPPPSLIETAAWKKGRYREGSQMIIRALEHIQEAIK